MKKIVAYANVLWYNTIYEFRSESVLQNLEFVSMVDSDQVSQSYSNIDFICCIVV